ncbi:hypothetical protein [Paramagnetospirillum kuznetsovii]|nr:hypothetical protein [Paramagnetospirillum kuznetsovii]
MMPNIFELGARRGEKTGDLRDHDEYDYRATEGRASTTDPRLKYVPTLELESTDALLEIAPGKKR